MPKSPFHDVAAAALVPFVLSPDDPDYEQYVSLGLMLAEQQAAINARLSARIEKAEGNSNLLEITIDYFSERFDVLARVIVPQVGSGLTISECSEYFETMMANSLNRLDHDFAPRVPILRDPQLRTRIKMRLLQRKSHWTAEALKNARLQQQRSLTTAGEVSPLVPPSFESGDWDSKSLLRAEDTKAPISTVTDRLTTGLLSPPSLVSSAVPNTPLPATPSPDRFTRPMRVSGATIGWRKRVVRDYRLGKAMTMPEFARSVAMSESAIRGIIKEDRRRFGWPTQERFIEKLGVSLLDWYRVP